MTKSLLCMLVAALALAPAVQVKEPPPPEAALIAALTHGDMPARRLAVRALDGIPAEGWSDDLVRALAGELRRIKALSQGIGSPPAEDAAEPSSTQDGEDDHLFMTAKALSRSHNPLVIRPLLPYAETGSMVGDALASFGELAVPELLRIAADTLSKTMQVDGAFEAIASAVKATSSHPVLARELTPIEPRPGEPSTTTGASPAYPISERSMAMIRAVAASRLLPPQKSWIIPSAAAGLALALEDSALIARVKLLARDPTATYAMGVNNSKGELDQASVGRFQRSLRSLLASQRR